MTELFHELSFWNVLVGAFAAAFLTWLSKHYWLRWEEYNARRSNRRLLIVELRGHRNDFAFHIATLRKMTGSAVTPSAIHLAKMIVPRDTMVMSMDTLRTIGHEHAHRVAQIRRVLQNRNAELRFVQKLLDDPVTSHVVHAEYLEFLTAAFERTSVRLDQCIAMLEGLRDTKTARQNKETQTILPAPHTRPHL